MTSDEVQLDLFDRDLSETASWSYGIVELENGDLMLAEIYWDSSDRPLAYSEPCLQVDQFEGTQGLIDSLRYALRDLEEDSTPIHVSVFHTDGDD